MKSKNFELEDDLRFKYHHPAPDLSKVSNPTDFYLEISKDLLQSFEEYVKANDFLDVFYTNLNDDFKKTFKTSFNSVILLIFPISKDIIKLPPSKDKIKLMDDEFQDIGFKLYNCSDFLRSNGFRTEVINPLDDKINLKKLAIGSNHSVIIRSNICYFKKGINMSIFGIFTSINNFPIKKENDMLWIKEYCSNCGACINKCPEDAFDENEQLIPKLCTAHREGCNECILNCIFFKKDYETIKERYNKKLRRTNNKV